MLLKLVVASSRNKAVHQRVTFAILGPHFICKYSLPRKRFHRGHLNCPMQIEIFYTFALLMRFIASSRRARFVTVTAGTREQISPDDTLAFRCHNTQQPLRFIKDWKNRVSILVRPWSLKFCFIAWMHVNAIYQNHSFILLEPYN